MKSSVAANYYRITEEKDRWDSFPLNRVVAALASFRGSILDVGCGTGKILEYLARDIRYVGVDLSGFAIERAQKLWSDRAGAEFFLSSGCELPFPDSSFDIVLMLFSLEHVTRPEYTLAECNRVLRKGGRIIILAPNLEFPLARPNALRHKSWPFRAGFAAIRIFDYFLRIMGIFSFRVLKENFTSRTGGYEKKDDDLWHAVSSWEVIKFLEKRGITLKEFWPEKNLKGARKLVQILPCMRWYGIPLCGVFEKNGSSKESVS